MFPLRWGVLVAPLLLPASVLAGVVWSGSDAIIVNPPDGPPRTIRLPGAGGTVSADGAGGVTVSKSNLPVPVSQSRNAAVTVAKNVGRTAIKNAGLLLVRSNPAIMLASLGLSAYDLFLDSQTGDLTVNSPSEPVLLYWASSYLPGQQFPDSASAVAAVWSEWQSRWGSNYCYNLVGPNDSGCYSLIYSCGASGGNSVCPVYSDSTNSSPRVATDSDITAAIDRHLNDDPTAAVNYYNTAVNNGIDVSGTYNLTGPTTINGQTVTKNYYDQSGNPITETTTTTYNITYNDNVVNVTETTITNITNNTTGETTTTTQTTSNPSPDSQSPPASSEVELPPFCEWAPPELCDYLFQADDVEYDPSLDTPQKNPIDPVFADAQAQIDQFKSRIGIVAAAGNCSIPIPVELGGVTGTGKIDFCQFQSAVQSIGSVLLGLAYLLSALIVLGVRL